MRALPSFFKNSAAVCEGRDLDVGECESSWVCLSLVCLFVLLLFLFLFLFLFLLFSFSIYVSF